MKAVTAEFAANAESEEALTAKNQVLGKSVQAAKDKLSVLDGQLDRQRGKLTELGAALDKAAAEFGENSKEAAAAQSAYNRQYTAVANLERQYQTARGQLAEFETAMRGAGDAAQEATASIGSADVLAGVAGWDMIKTAVNGVTDALRESVQVGMEFDAEVSNLAATMGKTVGELGDLRDFAKEMGANTVFTATEAAQALNYMALAGYDAETAMSTLPTVLNLAAAGGVELAQASDMVTDAQSALGLSLEQTTVLVDQMAQTSTKSNTSVAQLGEAILTVGGTAKFLAGGTQELNQVLGILADNSIKGAEGGTKLRNIILSLSSPTENAAKQLEELGVAVFDAEGNMRELSDVFPELQQALSRLTSKQQIEALSEIFNNRDIAAAQALLGTTAERWDELAAAIDNAQGSAQKMAETRMDNLAGDLTMLRSAADGARIAISDSLTPALRDLTQVGTGIVGFVGDAVTAFPLLGQAMAGVAAAGITLGAGMVASAANITSVTGAVGALTAALATNPFGQMAIAVGLGVTALTALAAAADDAGDKVDTFWDEVEEGRAAYETTTAAIREQHAEVMDMVSAVEALAAQENKTAAEKETLSALVDELNQKVPNLKLEYDSLNDSLSMTAEKIREIAIAEANQEEITNTVNRLKELHVQYAELETQMNEARGRAQSFSTALGEIDSHLDASKFGEYQSEMRAASAEANGLEAQMEELSEEIKGLEDEYNRLISSSYAYTDAANKNADAVDESEESVGNLLASMEELEEATLYAAGASDTLSDALKEQEKSGSLALDTALELIDAGYGAAIAIDEETGAVTLNTDAYAQLAGAKIEEQIATLESKRASIEAAAQLLREKLAAQDAANGYYDLAEAKTLATYADDAKALEVQIAALNRAKASLNSYGAATETAARRSSGASKKIKTQAEKDLAEYKSLKSELDHDKAMGLVEEADYYRRLAELRDQYLADAGNIDEYRKVSETIYKADQKALQEREKLWQTAGDNILKLEEDFQKELSDRAGEIVNSYKLFDAVPEYQKKAGTELIANLEDQIAAIEGFYGNIAALEERGVNAALVEDIRKMGVSASGELEGLLELTDEQLGKYAELYEEKQELANRIAMEELESLRDQTNQEIIDQLADVADLYDTNAPALGMAFSEKLAAGMFKGMPAVEAMAQTVANAAMSAFENTFNRDVEAMMTASGNRVSKGDIGELMAGFANSMTGAGNAGVVYPPVDVTLTIDGDVLATRQVEPMRRAERANPETLDDK